MYNFITQIAPRCHYLAEKRNKDASCLGCFKYLQGELAEYWAAYDAGRTADNISDLIAQAAGLSPEDFVAMYDAKIHNTTIDELADILITSASWYEAAYRANDGELPKIYRLVKDRTIDQLIINGAVHFVYGRVQSSHDMATLRQVVYLKMLYNDLRKD